MKEMSDREVRDFIEEWTWGTLIAVDGDSPYAIEVTYGSDGQYIYCGSRPDGKMARCIKQNQKVIFKICDADKYYPTWRAVTLFGKAERLSKREDILYGMKLIAKKLIHTAKKTNRTEKQLEKVGEMMAEQPELGGPIRIAIESFTGRSGGGK